MGVLPLLEMERASTRTVINSAYNLRLYTKRIFI